MLEERDGKIIARLPGRDVVVAQVTPQDRYRAMLAFGVRESVAAAVSKGLVTIRLAA